MHFLLLKHPISVLNLIFVNSTLAFEIDRIDEILQQIQACFSCNSTPTHSSINYSKALILAFFLLSGTPSRLLAFLNFRSLLHNFFPSARKFLFPEQVSPSTVSKGTMFWVCTPFPFESCTKCDLFHGHDRQGKPENRSGFQTWRDGEHGWSN